MRVAHNVSLEGLGVELLGFRVETRETGLGVRNEHATVGSTLHDGEDSRTSRCSLQTSVEVGLEWSWSIFSLSLGDCVFSFWLSNTLELVGEAELGKGTSSD